MTLCKLISDSPYAWGIVAGRGASPGARGGYPEGGYPGVGVGTLGQRVVTLGLEEGTLGQRAGTVGHGAGTPVHGARPLGLGVRY